MVWVDFDQRQATMRPFRLPRALTTRMDREITVAGGQCLFQQFATGKVDTP